MTDLEYNLTNKNFITMKLNKKLKHVHRKTEVHKIFSAIGLLFLFMISSFYVIQCFYYYYIKKCLMLLFLAKKVNVDLR